MAEPSLPPVSRPKERRMVAVHVCNAALLSIWKLLSGEKTTGLKNNFKSKDGDYISLTGLRMTLNMSEFLNPPPSWFQVCQTVAIPCWPCKLTHSEKISPGISGLVPKSFSLVPSQRLYILFSSMLRREHCFWKTLTYILLFYLTLLYFIVTMINSGYRI